MPKRITGPSVPSLPQVVSQPPAPQAAPGAPKSTGWGPPPADPSLRKKDQGLATFQNVPGALFKDGISPEDIKQGALGDCYLLSALSSLANVQPDVIKNAIRENADGTFTVTFHKDSLFGLFDKGQKPIEVTIDNDFPTKDGKTQLYTKAKDGELWPLVIEKAYAKLDGGYQRVGKGGSPATIWQALTGKSGAMTANLVEGDGSIFRKLKNALDEKRPVAASTAPALKNYEGTGLVKAHVYAILGVSEKDGERFVTLRNPWGHTEPGKDGKDDGVFTMKLHDFKKQFAFTYFGG